MTNPSLQKTPMPELDPDTRSRCFEEVALGYTEEMAKEEAGRCLQCKHKPCMNGCPVSVHIPAFIEKVAAGEFEEAYEIIKSTNSLPAVCGRVCPQETQCEAKCVRGIKGESVGIGRLERFVADYYMKHSTASGEKPVPNGHKVAVVGSGPASLTCAGDLAKLGYGVSVFEAFHTAGGVLMYGIPQFRLPKEVVQAEIDQLKELGVEINTNMVIGKVLSVDELFDMGFEAVFVGTGAGLPSFMGIEGEGLVGVYSANEFLTRINLMKAYRGDYDTPIIHSRRVAVVGGGNVAMDAARCARRLGEEGIAFKMLTNPVRINGDEQSRVVSLTCVKMELGEPDASGRRRPEPIEGSEFDVEADAVIIAIGNTPNPLIRSTTPGVEANRRGCLVVNEETLETTRPGVFAGGDAVTGAATVILAMGAGKKAAQSIDAYLRKNQI